MSALDRKCVRKELSGVLAPSARSEMSSLICADLVRREQTRRRSIWLNVLECHGGAVVSGKVAVAASGCTGGGKVR
jgi:hypothetical protein